MKQIRVLIIDESVICRDLLRAALGDATDIDLVGAAPNGKVGLARQAQLEPDLIVLSADAPDQSTVEVTRQALETNPQVGILLTTQHEALAADQVVEALEAGAFDFVVKAAEDECNGAELVEVMARRLLPKIRSFSTARWSRMARAHTGAPPTERPAARARPPSALKRRGKTGPVHLAEVVVVGVSTGGPEALARLIPSFPGTFPLPIVVVLHLPRQFTTSLATALDERASLRVREAEDGDDLRPGTVYLAPGGHHLELERGSRRRLLLRLTDAPPENGCKPAVDVLFRSAAAACRAKVLALILTGMGDDGAKGLAALKAAGAYVVAQDEASSVVWGMPGRAVQAGVADEVLPLDRIARRVLEQVGG